MDDDKSNNYIPRGSWIETAATCEDFDEAYDQCVYSKVCGKCQPIALGRCTDT